MIKEIKLYGIYEFDGKENLRLILRYSKWTKRKIKALNSLIIKYFLIDRIIYNKGPDGCIEIKRVYESVNSVSSVNVEKVASYLPHNIYAVFKALEPVLDRLYR